MSYLHTHWRDVDVSVSICFALDVMHSPLPSSSALLPKGIWCLNYVTGGQFFFSLQSDPQKLLFHAFRSRLGVGIFLYPQIVIDRNYMNIYAAVRRSGIEDHCNGEP